MTQVFKSPFLSKQFLRRRELKVLRKKKIMPGEKIKLFNLIKVLKNKTEY